MKNNKILLAIMTVALIVITLITSAQIPTAKPEIKNLPIAIVNNDNSQLTTNIVDKLKNTLEEQGTLKVEILDNKEQVLNEMKSQNYYGALIIDKNFSSNITKLAAGGKEQARIDILINQGKNINVSNQLTNILSKIVDNIGNNLSTQTITTIKEKNVPLSADVALSLQKPIITNVEIVNGVGDLTFGTLPFFQITWMASLISAVILFINYNKKTFSNKLEEINFKMYNIIFMTINSLVIGYGTVYLIKWILQVEFNNINKLGIFLSTASLVVMILIYGLANWLKFAVIPLAVLLMLFSLPLVQLAPEMLSNFYINYVLSWTPVKFIVEGAKEILFFNGNYFNSNTEYLLIILLVGLMLLFTKFKTNKYI